jgi:sugar phosphate isomerase/epimerase
MLLGLHTYSLHLHGMGQNWGGFKLQWEPVWSIFGLMDEAKKLGLDGLHLTAADLGATDQNHLRDVRRAAEERGLYLEYNFSLDASGYDDRLTHTMEEGIAIAESIGSDIGKISMDVKRTHPVCGSAFHPKVRKLAPLSFTNHFSDHRIVFDQYGCRITGVATGSGDVPMRQAYQIIKANPNMKRLNIEVEFDPGTDGREEARRREYQAVVDSIRFTREELGVGQESKR